jgi:hypothetical protein
MSSIIAASIFVPLMVIMATVVVDKLEQNTFEETEEQNNPQNKKGKNEPPDDLVDLSGGTFGI